MSKDLRDLKISRDGIRQETTQTITLPPRPSSFHVKYNSVHPLRYELRPNKSPRKAEYIGSIEWACSPVSDRLDHYYLNRRRSNWLLWIKWQDENDWDHAMQWYLYAYGPKKGVDLVTAAIYLLMDAWEAEAKLSGLVNDFMINNTGLLSVDELSMIARIVWPDS